MKSKLMRSLLAALLAVTSFIGVAQNRPDGSRIVKHIENVLCPDGIPVGKALSDATPDTRVVKVKDFSDAHACLLRLCPQKEIKEEKKGGYIYYTYTLPEGKGELILTDKVKTETGEIAALEVKIEVLKGKVSRLKFIK